MLAAGLTLLIFCVLFFVGLSILLLIRRNGPNPGETLISPAFGLAALVIPALVLNQIGFPIGHFGPILITGFVLAAGIIITLKRSIVQWRTLMCIVPATIVGFVLVAWPQFFHGFDWVSFSNDDMTNYALAADRLATQGFYQNPPLRIDEFYRDFMSLYWSMYAVNAERTGVETLLALVISIVHLRGFQVFMPFIVACNLSMISITAALGWSFRRRKGDAAVVAVLLATAALSSFGTLYELLGQVCGLCILAALVAIIACREDGDYILRIPQLSIALGILVAAQLLIYPELLPFAALFYAAWAILSLMHRKITLAAFITLTALIAIWAFAFTLTNFYKMISLVVTRAIGQVPHGPLPHGHFVFPYYFVPSGLANLWGLTAISNFSGEPLLSLSIAFALILSLMVLFVGFLQVVRDSEATSIMCLILGLVGIVLFFKRIDFGLFKLAMYLQPFLWATLFLMLIKISIPKAFVAVILAILICGNLFTQWQYVETSQDGKYGLGAGFVEVRHATADRLLESLSRIEGQTSDADALVSDTSNHVLAKYEIGYTNNKPLFFITREFRANLVGTPLLFINRFRPEYASLKRRDALLIKSAQDLVSSNTFVFDDGAVATFVVPHYDKYRKIELISTGDTATVLNRSDAHGVSKIVYVSKLSEAQNHLVFVQSTLGYVPGPGADISKVTLFQVEPDYFYANNTMAGIGRYLLFNVLNPTKTVRLLLNLTDTLAADGSESLPPVVAVGTRSLRLSLIGRGSARIVSPPMEALSIDGHWFIGLDMGREGKEFRIPRNGLMKLYGQNIALDSRHLTAFARNISVISEEKYEASTAPSCIRNIRQGLADKNLLYSGIYEDGWISEHAMLSLRGASNSLEVSGMIPKIDDPAFFTKISLSIDRQVVYEKILRIGEFNIVVPFKRDGKRHAVFLNFSKYQFLPSADGRPAAAMLKVAGFCNGK